MSSLHSCPDAKGHTAVGNKEASCSRAGGTFGNDFPATTCIYHDGGSAKPPRTEEQGRNSCVFFCLNFNSKG